MADTTGGTITYYLDAADRGLNRGLREARQEVERTGNQIEKTGAKSFGSFAGNAAAAANGIAESIASVARPIAGLALTSSVGFGSLITYSFNATRQVQGFVAGIQSLTKNSQEASDVIKSMVDYVQGKPFDRIEVLGAARQLLTYGRSAQQTKKDIELLGRAVIVSGAEWSDLARVYGRVSSGNRLMTEDFNILMDAGVNVGKSLTKNLGVSMEDLREKLSAGEIKFEDFRKALEDALPADVVAKNSNTIDQKISTLQSSFRNLGFALLGVDFAKLDGKGQPLVKPGGLLDRLNQGMTEASATVRRPEFQQAFTKLGQSLAAFTREALPVLLNGMKWLAENLPTIVNVVLALAAAFVVAKTVALTMTIIQGIIAGITLATKAWRLAVLGWRAAQLLANATMAAAATQSVVMSKVVTGSIGNINSRLVKFVGWGIFAGLAVAAANEIIQANNRVKQSIDSVGKQAQSAYDKVDSVIRRFKEGKLNAEQYRKELTATWREAEKARKEADKLEQRYSGLGGVFNYISDLTDQIGRGVWKNLGVDLPGRALGGPVRAGGAYQVGERGRELFVPSTDGVVVPHNQLMSMEQGKWGNTPSSTTVNIKMDNSGIVARSRNEWRDIMKDGIAAVNEELRSRRMPEIGAA